MKPDIHPEYRDVLFHDTSSDTYFVVGSTVQTSETKEHEGQTYPYMPPGIVRLRVDRESGLRVRGQPKGSVMEYFLEESLPDWDTDSSGAIDTENLEQIF